MIWSPTTRSTDTTSHAKHRRFDAFGNVTFDSATSLVVTFGYTGKLFDTRTGLQWNINRWYDPFIGQWISEDPIGFAGGDENLRRYVGNSTPYVTDPSGFLPIRLVKQSLAMEAMRPSNLTRSVHGGITFPDSVRLDERVR